MKTLLTILLTAITLAATSQDSTRIRASLAIQPIVVNMAGDTATFLHWRAYDVDRADTTAGMGTLVSLLDRKGKTVAQFNVQIPASVVKTWALDPKPIDDYILLQNQRLKRK